jgi:hypothetical protein
MLWKNHSPFNLSLGKPETGEIMVIESTLSRRTFIKLIVLPVFRSFTFYFSTIFGGVFIALGIIQNSWVFILFPVSFLFAALTYYGWWILSRCFGKKHKPIFLKRTITFTDEYVEIISSDTKRTIKWDAFEKWTIYSACYYLKYKNGETLVIPQDDIPENLEDSFMFFARGNSPFLQNIFPRRRGEF